MFVRFVAGTEAENAYRLDGVFVESRLLCDEGRLYAYEIGLLDETYAWFNEYQPCPPFAATPRSGEWTRNAVAWFRDDAGDPLRRAWDLVHLLRENGVPTGSSRAVGRVGSFIATVIRCRGRDPVLGLDS